GHKKGSFTGADKDRVGKFQAAHGGTLFLDEIGDMELSLQAKLLRAIENGEVEVVGENAPRKVDVRLIAATNHDLLEMVEAGTFRRDLYHRLNVLQLSVPPLRERREDIESLAYHFLMQLCEEHGRRFDKITQQALGLLRNYHWPGNIRELRNVMEKAVIFAEGSDITHADIRDALNLKAAFQEASADPTLPQSLREAREAFERSYILEVLERCEGRIGDTADALGIDRTNLFRKMQKYGIEKNS
ncbi:MAG: sigma-54-dependent Fis family transcriptional regulator, partial [Calditrichaeota bacterium]|nr:sigma-54-dependent Fis family transcriptional regulator [Calditrichota bacterium]